MDIKEIAKQYKLNLIEISILVRLYKEHPNLLPARELTSDVSIFPIIKSGCDSLVQKKLVVKVGERYVIAEELYSIKV